MKNRLKKQILDILKDFPSARDSDQWLTLKIWATFYPNRIYKDEHGNQYVYLKDVMDLPREDNVKRLRAKIQNEENQYLPTSLIIVKQRKINVEKWREYLSNEYKRL